MRKSIDQFFKHITLHKKVLKIERHYFSIVDLDSCIRGPLDVSRPNLDEELKKESVLTSTDYM